MENFVLYIAKASSLLAIFLLAYHAFLKKETFFNSNRWYLLAGLATSALLPLIVYTKVIWVDPAPMPVYDTIDYESLVMWQQAQVPAEPEFTINWFDVLAGMYITGVLFFLTRFAIDLMSLRKLIKGQHIVREDGFLMVDSPAIKSPFSFFNYIVYNSRELEGEELQSIICHEKVHSRQHHSLDMLISQLFCIAFWFNPFSWMYKKSISQNLEFIADAEATKLIADKKAYQKTLLKITMQPECIAITNHFYQSLIKKRIVMLNKQQSKKSNSWKYAIVLPALAAFMLVFQVQTVAQERQGVKQETVQAKTKISIEVTKDSKDEELQADKKMIKEEFGADVNFENIKRNQNKEITAIKVTVNDAGQSQHYEVSGNTPITPFTIEIEKDNSGRNSVNFGTSRGDNRIMARAFAIHSDNGNDTIMLRDKKVLRLGALDTETFPPTPPMAPGFRSGSLNIDSDDFLVVIDGVKKGKGDTALKRLRSNEIASINIFKGKEAKKKYGKEAKNGVIEITTRKADRLMMRHPQAYRIEIPEMGEHFEFNFDMPDFPDMEGLKLDIEDLELGTIEDLQNIFPDNGDMLVYPGELSPEDKERIREKIEALKSMDHSKMWKGLHDRINGAESREESLKEMEQVKKEMEQARKELEEARKELEKTRAQLNKKA